MQTQTKNRSPTYQKISPTKKQQSFFRVADAVASLSNHNQSKLGCVLVDKHRIISSGHNSSTRCSPLQKKMDVSRFGSPDQHKGLVHAETACLLPLIRQGVWYVPVRLVYHQTPQKWLSGAFQTLPRLYVPPTGKRRQARVFQRRGRLCGRENKLNLLLMDCHQFWGLYAKQNA